MKGHVLVVVALMLALAITGCSGNSNQNANITVGENESNTENAKETSKDPSKVVWYATVDFWNPPKTWKTDLNSIQGKITEKTGLTFDFDIPAQDGETKLNLMLATSGDDFPDVVTVTNDLMVKKLIDSGKVWNLDEFIQKYDPDSHLLKDFPSDVRSGIEKRDGGFYAYPSHLVSYEEDYYPITTGIYSDNLKFGQNGALVVNSNILKEAGLTLDDINTESGLLKAYQKVKDMGLKVNGAPVIPLLVDGKDYYNETMWFLEKSFGAMEVDKDGNYRDLLLAPETKNALNFLYKSMKARYFEPGQLTVDNAAVKEDMASGRVFTFIGNSANTSFQLNDYWVSPGAILSDTGAKPVLAKNKIPSTGWMKTMISKNTKEPEKLAKWLSFMSSKEGMLLHIYGFEGVHYNFNDQGQVVKTEQGIKDAADYMNTGVVAFWPFHNTSFSWSMEQPPTEETDKQAVTAWKVTTAYGKSPETVIYNDAGFNTFPADLFPPGSDLANIELQVKTYTSSQISKIVMSKDDQEFNNRYDEMIAQLKKLGIDKLNQEKNKYAQEKKNEFGNDQKGVNS